MSHCPSQSRLLTPARLRALLVVILVLLPGTKLLAGVLVAPTVIFLSDRQRTGRMTLQNTENKPQEVTVKFAFGLPTSDSLGDVTVVLQDSAVTDPRSCMGWIRAFPRRLILPPNSTQIVRFVASPPRDLDPGESWARVVVRSQDAEANLPNPQGEETITTKLNMIMQTAIMLKYRRGEVFTELQLTKTEVSSDGEKVTALIGMQSKGNASYIGRLNTTLKDAEGREISKSSIQLAVYRELTRRVILPVTEGEYTKPFKVEVEITSKGRTDIAAEDMIYGNEISYSSVVD